MSHSENSANDETTGNDRSTGRTDGEATDETAAWFAASTLRMALAVVGFVLLLFALGQAVGLDLLGMVADALSTQLGRWLLVAFFGLLLIMIAVRGFRARAE